MIFVGATRWIAQKWNTAIFTKKGIHTGMPLRVE